MDAIDPMSVFSTTCVDKYYRTTIPREVRKTVGREINDEAEWILKDNKITVKKSER